MVLISFKGALVPMRRECKKLCMHSATLGAAPLYQQDSDKGQSMWTARRGTLDEVQAAVPLGSTRFWQYACHMGGALGVATSS